MASWKKIDSAVDSTINYHHYSGGVEEILLPTLIVSGGRSYRKLTDIEFGRRPEDRDRRRHKRSPREKETDLETEEETRVNETSYTDDVYDEGEDIERELTGVEKMRNGNFKLKLPVPSAFFKYIIGKEGRTKKGIERDTECHLSLPARGQEGDVGMSKNYYDTSISSKTHLEFLMHVTCMYSI